MEPPDCYRGAIDQGGADVGVLRTIRGTLNGSPLLSSTLAQVDHEVDGGQGEGSGIGSTMSIMPPLLSCGLSMSRPMGRPLDSSHSCPQAPLLMLAHGADVSWKAITTSTMIGVNTA